MAIHIKDDADFKEKLVQAGDKLVVVDFFATWCGPCKMIAPKLEELAKELEKVIVVLKVDVEECESVALEYDISTMPTFVFIKGNETLDKFNGANYDKLKTTVQKYK